jgi:ferrous iron transport protein A
VHLGSCSLDHDVVVVAVDMPSEFLLRLSEIGVRTGALVRVTHRGPADGRVVAISGSRIAIDARTAAAIEVVPA